MNHTQCQNAANTNAKNTANTFQRVMPTSVLRARSSHHTVSLEGQGAEYTSRRVPGETITHSCPSAWKNCRDRAAPYPSKEQVLNRTRTACGRHESFVDLYTEDYLCAQSIAVDSRLDDEEVDFISSDLVR